jgi:acyl carrier protein
MSGYSETDIYDKINAVFNTFFKTTSIALQSHFTTADVPGWNSMNHVQLILKIEEVFDVRFKHAEIAAFENVGDLVRAIQRRIGG